MVFLNETGIIGQAIIGANGITGSLFLTLLLILIIFIILALAMRIPIEATAIIYLPLIITITAYSGDFLATFGVTLIFLGVVLGKNIFFNH
jgi:hypothetical protein